MFPLFALFRPGLYYWLSPPIWLSVGRSWGSEWVDQNHEFGIRSSLFETS